MESPERLQTICKAALQSKGLEEYSKRLDDELYEVEAQGEFDYLLDLYDNNTKFANNENNLFIAYLLDIVTDWNPEEGFDYVQGEFPDVDIDYLPEVRDYLKNQWAAEKYGQENICSIGTYGTLGIKSAMLDMAKIYGYEKSDIQAITVKMEDKDDDGNLLEWDKALELYPDFKKYCDEHQEVAESAKMLLDRNRSGGVHAGGLIVANCPISDFVPLEVRSVKKDNPKGHIVSAWSEGQSTQDLQPVGLIKFDLLVVNGLKQYGMGAKLVKERYGLSGICCHEGGMDWSDTSYLNDPKALAMANDADLKGIFQFDSDVLRKMVKAGGVTSFDDLPAYSSLNRPGPLNMKMDQTFCERKQGAAYNIHPLMKPILGGSYGVMIYQEQVMKMLNVVGGIPLIHCEKIRKAISKKKEDQFAKYKEQFIVNGQKKMGVSEDFMNDLWDQIEAFAAYGFNKSHAYAYAYISARQLWLKAHYPLEFFCAVLDCEKKQEKIKTYKIDAKKHGVEVCGVHINKSKESFVIDDDNKIYFGFGKIKGVGKEVAARIVEGQPYSSFSDFLNRWGTESKVIKPLIALGAFEEDYDNVTLYKFYEFFKDHQQKRRSRQKRNVTSMEKYQNDLEDILAKYLPNPDLFGELNQFDDEEIESRWKQIFGEMIVEEEYKYKGQIRTRNVSIYKKILGIVTKRDTSIRTFEEREKDDDERPPHIEQFNPNKYIIDKATEKLITNPKDAESEFYGFTWVHELEESPNYTGLTFEEFEARQVPKGPVEVKILKPPKMKTSRKGNVYWSMQVEDATNKEAWITIWEDDYERFADDFIKDSLVRIWVQPPFGGFNSYNLDSPKKHERARVLPANKADDHRVFVMEKKEDKKTPIKDENPHEFEII